MDFLETCGAVRLALCCLLCQCEQESACAHEVLAKHQGQEDAWASLEFFYSNRRRIEGTILLLGEGSIRTSI